MIGWKIAIFHIGNIDISKKVQFVFIANVLVYQSVTKALKRRKNDQKSEASVCSKPFRILSRLWSLHPHGHAKCYRPTRRNGWGWWRLEWLVETPTLPSDILRLMGYPRSIDINGVTFVGTKTPLEVIASTASLNLYLHLVAFWWSITMVSKQNVSTCNSTLVWTTSR